MTKYLIKKTLNVIFPLAVFIMPVVVFADNINLPQPMIGQTVVQDGGSGLIYYGGTGANEVVFNPVKNYLIGLNPKNFLFTGKECLGPDPLASFCYSIDPSNSNPAQIMRSRTYLNYSEIPSEEIAAIIYDNIVIGDAMGFDYSNFALYGRNLAQNSAGLLNGSWRTGSSYTVNSLAQSSYDTNRKTEYINRILRLKSEATEIRKSPKLFINGDANESSLGPVSQSISLNLQYKSVLYLTEDESSKYPEGKIWSYTSINETTMTAFSNQKYSYKGLGTIIIDLRDGTSEETLHLNIPIKASDKTKDKLGLIVLGNINIQADIDAAIFATGTITIGDNVEINGSLMAKEFKVDNTNGVRIYYDYRYETGWPPGFRYFNMPIVNQSKQ